MRPLFFSHLLCLGVALAGCSNPSTGDGRRILHVSYDPTRELFEDLNRSFQADWAQSHGGEAVDIRMSHGGSGRQARAVIEGLEADIVSLALAYDVDAIAREGRLLPDDWSAQLPEGGSPFFSTIVFVVRAGNPKGIRDWPDLVRGDVRVITPNPKTSGGARWAYLAAYGWAKRHGFDGLSGDAAGEAMVRSLFSRVPVLDSGARGSSTTFTRNRIGDVLLTWENEAHLLTRESGSAAFAIVVPSESIRAEPPVAVVRRNVERHRNREVVEAYASFFFQAEAQETAARHHYRPRNAEVAARHRGEFPDIGLFSIEEVAGSWAQAQRAHFADGALFDRVYVPLGNTSP